MKISTILLYALLYFVRCKCNIHYLFYLVYTYVYTITITILYQSIEKNFSRLHVRYSTCTVSTSVLTMTRYDDVTDVKGAQCNFAYRRSKCNKKRTRYLYSRYISGWSDAASQKRIRSMLRPGTLPRCTLMRMKVQWR